MHDGLKLLALTALLAALQIARAGDPNGLDSGGELQNTDHSDFMKTPSNDLSGAASAGTGVVASGAALGAVGARNAVAGSLDSNAGAQKANASGRSAAASVLKKSGKRAGFARASGGAANLGQKFGKFGSFASGHKKTSATIKHYNSSSGFKFGRAGAFGATEGSARRFSAKKKLGAARGSSGFAKKAAGGAKGFASGNRAKSGFKVSSASAGHAGKIVGARGATGLVG